MVIIMRNFTKILCVVLALVVALSAASCSLSKQYAYTSDDGDLPIGLYIYYLRQAYNEAEDYAQKDTEKYDAEKGTYDGSKSFLKMEITDDDGKTAVAEDWIKEKAAENMNEAIAVYYQYNQLGCTMDEALLETDRKTYKDAWDNGYSYYGNSMPALSETYEPFGIGLDALFFADVEIPMMKTSVFDATYKDVTDDELKKFYEENYTSYHYFSMDLYTTSTDANNTTSYESVSDAQITAYTAAFDGYAAAINGGESTFSEQFEAFKTAYNSDATATENKAKLDSDTDLNKAILALKDGEAKQVIIGENDNARKIYLIYKEAIAGTTEAYFEESSSRDSVLSVMKEDEFEELLKKIAAEIDGMSSACKSYKPSMFES